MCNAKWKECTAWRDQMQTAEIPLVSAWWWFIGSTMPHTSPPSLTKVQGDVPYTTELSRQPDDSSPTPNSSSSFADLYLGISGTLAALGAQIHKCKRSPKISNTPRRSSSRYSSHWPKQPLLIHRQWWPSSEFSNWRISAHSRIVHKSHKALLASVAAF